MKILAIKNKCATSKKRQQNGQQRSQLDEVCIDAEKEELYLYSKIKVHSANKKRNGIELSTTDLKPLNVSTSTTRAARASSWRRRRKNQEATLTMSKQTTKANNDNCNYSYYFNKINKLLLIACMLLITTTVTTICLTEATPATATTTREIATSNIQQRQLPQQQLFAMLLTKNNLGASAGALSSAAALNVGAAATSSRHFLMLHADDDDEEDEDIHENRNDSEEAVVVAPRIPTEQLHVAIAPPLPIPAASLETTGFVSDDGLQYEKAEKSLAAAGSILVSSAQGNNCPKECKCLNVFFDCGKLHLDRVPALPYYVQILDLIGNKLNDSAVLEIKNLSELQKLSLKRNQLDVIPKFVGLTMLKQLILANNRIQSISSEALAELPKLKTLDLSKNYLHSVSANSFPKSNRLARLVLNANEISSIDEHAFEMLKDLVDLELNNNRLFTLPGGVFQNLTKLKRLSLNYNHLEINWGTFRGLLGLQKLFLKSNNIRVLQDGVFYVMHNIETIELDHNGITYINRQGLFNLTKLHHLSLSNNSITRIELDTWEFTQSLETLDLSNNNISEFKPQHLDCLQHLKELNLAHNKIQYLMDNTFDCVKNLEELNLRRNRLAWAIEDPNAAPPFKALRKLRKLDLYGNNLKQINSKSLSGLVNLELLNLGGNALATVQTGAFEHMSRLQKLVFKSLNLICDCEILWFRRFLQTRFSNNAGLQGNVVCGYPDSLLDRELQTLNVENLLCGDSPKPVLKKEPTNMLAVKGTNITMECVATSPAAASLAASDELKIKWRHDNLNVRDITSHGAYSAAETQIHHDQSTNLTTIIGYLRLYNVNYESAGRYQCVVSNAFGTNYSQRFKISIGIHPNFLQIPSNLTIDAGDTARLVCSATGDPMPEIALQKFGASDFPAATERRLQVIREENAFIITNAKPSDTGIYTCTAESAAGEIKINATLMVNDKPQPAIPIIRKEAILGANTVLECLNEELVQVHREWYKENKPFHISSNSYAERYYFTADRELLVIVNTQSVDAGHYRCEITDSFKTITLQTELIVVMEGLNTDIIILSVVTVTVACVLIGSCVIWSIMCYQRRKLDINMANQQRLGGSMGRVGVGVSAAVNQNMLDQTQLTTLNRTYLQPATGASRVQQKQANNQFQQNTRPRSLVDLELNQEQCSRLIVTTTPNYQSRLGEDEGLTLTYLQQNDLDHQQDHLSSKDSGTGSDAAVKRSIEDFSLALLPTASTPMVHRIINEHLCHDDGNLNDENDDDNDLQFAPTRALGVSQYVDDIELDDIGGIGAGGQKEIYNNNHNYVSSGISSNRLPNKCGTILNSTICNVSSPKTATTVDI